MKKVAIVAQGLGDGGAERVASILANGLSKYYTVLFVAAYSSDKEYVLNDHVQYTYIDVSAKNGIERLEKRNKRIKKVFQKYKDINTQNLVQTAGDPECRSGIGASGTAIRADAEGDPGQGDAGSFICDRNPGVRACRDPDGRYQYEHWISGLSRRGEGADDPIWTFGESSAGGVSGACEKRAAAWKGIGLFLCQLYGRRDEPAGILEDYQILRRESRD